MKELTPPKYFGKSKIKQFLCDIEFIFELDNKIIPDFRLDMHKIKQVKLIGQLLIYKFISYTATHRCFNNPHITWSPIDKTIEAEFAQTGFLEIINTHIRNPKDAKNILNSYKKLKIKTDKSFLFAPKRLIRTEENIRESLEADFIRKVVYFYKDNKVISLISVCISELISNFWAHATEETNTVMVSKGNTNNFEICFADNGNGIISTLKNMSDYKNTKDLELLKKSVTKGVTSKKGSNHMGYGLYLIAELVKCNNGELDIYSEGYFIEINKNKFDSGKTGYWKGTIISLNINLNEPKGLNEIAQLKYDESIKINWR